MSDMRRVVRLERALLAMFLEAEEMAVSGHETCTYPGSIFNDRIWRDAEGDSFKIAVEARRVLKLQPFSHVDRRVSFRGGAALAKFRKKEHECLARGLR